jgi:hypothetical protein
MNKHQALEEIYKLIDSVRGNGAYPAENCVKYIIDELDKEIVREAYSRMASKINSHGFIGLMTGKYELKEVLLDK